MTSNFVDQIFKFALQIFNQVELSQPSMLLVIGNLDFAGQVILQPFHDLQHQPLIFQCLAAISPIIRLSSTYNSTYPIPFAFFLTWRHGSILPQQNRRFSKSPQPFYSIDKLLEQGHRCICSKWCSCPFLHWPFLGGTPYRSPYKKAVSTSTILAE